ncbi:MAG TPA: sulfatase-like hydrolase/transferase [Sediminibacterium sp.]|uniref:sulfatase-like hydrolase/transferase n=1 Tax=Sediminibacterium sp. TaxID=1917865 RepID=UPI000AB00CFB|nr:sulfatase-like hydrolase/transferase [Sediminibacterium sp.]HLD53121.1 sulfatase-like hydrolase/transferase [Sediminibacterium sp.]
MQLLSAILKLILLVAIQLIIEQAPQLILGHPEVTINLSFIFIINCLLLLFTSHYKWFYILQFISLAIYAIVLVPQLFFFNMFNFYARMNYIFLSPGNFIIAFFYLLIAAAAISGIVWIQVKLIKSMRRQIYVVPVFALALIIAEFAVPTVEFLSAAAIPTKDNTPVNNQLVPWRKLYIDYIGNNNIEQIQKDYNKFSKGKTSITPYQCNTTDDETTTTLAPTIQYLQDTNANKDFLLLMESWGELAEPKEQEKLINHIRNLFESHGAGLTKYYSLDFGRTCFHGNTSSAEGRELLNMNDEESYRAFLERNVAPPHNITQFKNQNGYHTIAGFTASKQYGSNMSNAEGFRRALGFKSRFYYEELSKHYKDNKENTYKAVFDENLIDSILNESKRYEKVFAYALTINTHTPFRFDVTNNIDGKYYYKIKRELFKSFKENQQAYDQYYRIASIINHTFKRVAEANQIGDASTTTASRNSAQYLGAAPQQKPKPFDRILIIGDHANPDFRTRGLYNMKTVPFLIIRRRK